MMPSEEQSQKAHSNGFSGSPDDSSLQEGVTHPLVSVIVRTFNRRELLLRCLKSLEEQIYDQFEVIVINDAGEDVSQVVNSRTFPTRYLTHETRKGKATALNTGFRHARGTYLTILDDDDVVYPDHLSILITAIENTGNRVVYTDSLLRIEEKQGDKWICREKRQEYSQPFDSALLMQTNYIPVLNVLFDHKLLKEYGYVREDLEVLEDWELWSRFALATPFYHIKQVTAEYSQRMDGSNATQLEANRFDPSMVKIRNSRQNDYLPIPRMGLIRPMASKKGRVEVAFLPQSVSEAWQGIESFLKQTESLSDIRLKVLDPGWLIELQKQSLSDSVELVPVRDMNELPEILCTSDFCVDMGVHDSIRSILEMLDIPLVSIDIMRNYITSHPIYQIYYPSSLSKQRQVSIIMLTRNQLDYTEKCISSLFAHTDNFELIVVDNASTDGTVEYLSELIKANPNIKVILNSENKGFGAANNQGIPLCSGDYVLFLNNDTIVTEGWLTGLVSTLESNPEWAIAGPVTNNIVGIQKINDPQYELAHLDAYSAVHQKANRGKMSVTHRVIGFCLLIKKDVLDKIGGFDLRYGIGNFEDDDLCIRAWIHGYKSVICHEVFIHHFGSVTFKEEYQREYAGMMIQNAYFFRDKWSLPFENHVLEPFYVTGIDLLASRENAYFPPVSSHSVPTYLEEASALYEAGRLEHCKIVLRIALELDPENLDSWYNLLVVCMENQDWREAVDCLNHLPEDYEDVAKLKVRVCLEIGDFEQARTIVLDHQKLYPQDSDWKEYWNALTVV